MQHNTHNNRTQQGGFTMIETFVAITILLISIAGPITIATRGLSSASYARNQVIASHLAKEAVELVRNKRDSNKMSGVGWLDSMASCVSADASSKCKVEPTNGQFSICVAGVCPALNLDGSGIYTYGFGTETMFTREIAIDNDVASNPDEVLLYVTVSWNTSAGVKTFTINENLMDWQ